MTDEQIIDLAVSVMDAEIAKPDFNREFGSFHILEALNKAGLVFHYARPGKQS